MALRAFTLSWRIGAIVLASAVLSGCAADQTATREAVTGISSAAQQATAVPSATPAPTATPKPTAEPTPLPEGFSQPLHEIYANVDHFQGVVTVTSNPGTPNAVTTILHQWYKKPDQMKLEVVNSSGSQAAVASTLVFDGQSIIYYDPSNETMTMVRDQPRLGLLVNLLAERFSAQLLMLQVAPSLFDLKSSADIQVGASGGRVAARNTTIVDVTPHTATTRFSKLRLWLHNNTKAPLKAEAYRADGSIAWSFEYTQFDPTTDLPDGVFSFTPRTKTKVATPGVDELMSFAGYQSTTFQYAQNTAGFPLLRPSSLPSGMSEHSVKAASFGGSTVIAILYGSGPNDTSTLFVERPASVQPPSIRVADAVAGTGSDGVIYNSRGMLVVEWTVGTTALTLASTLPKDQVLAIARSVR